MLDKILWNDSLLQDSAHDFGKDIIPSLVRLSARVYAYPFKGYWVDVGTVSSYWQAHMDLLKEPPTFDLYDRSWIIHTRSEERPPVKIESGAVVDDSLICDGCIIETGAQVVRSVLSPGVIVKGGALVKESIILTDTTIESQARVQRAVLDKQVSIGSKAQVGDVVLEEMHIAMVGKGSTVPPQMVIEPGGIVGPTHRHVILARWLKLASSSKPGGYPMSYERLAGILLHPTSLPGPDGIGDLGPESYRWIDFLSATGCGLWQILPLGPTGFGDSPYQCFSAFAGNPYLVSPALLLDDGLLTRADPTDRPSFPSERVDYGPVIQWKLTLLDRAFARLQTPALAALRIAFEQFCTEEDYWLRDYALFMTLKDEYGGLPWNQWPQPLRQRQPQALESFWQQVRAITAIVSPVSLFRQW